MTGAVAPGAGARRPAEFSIDRDGGWRYRGSPVAREALVRLLAGMLRRDAAGYLLETPEGQRLRVDVADAPFVAIDWECRDDGACGQVLVFTTSLGRTLTLDAEHPLHVRADPSGEVRAYLLLDGGLEALVHRNAFYRLAEIAVEEPGNRGGRLGVLSAGRFFALEP